MLLYHVGFKEIKDPDIFYGRKNADFGQGFYMTPDKEFAYRWAREQTGERTIVNCYELDTTGLQVKELSRDGEWFGYIYDNRHGKLDEVKADVIIGPIANDIIYNTNGITTSGYLDKDESMELLMIGPEYIQVVLKTEKGKANLKWLSSQEMTHEQLKDYKAQMAKEELEFQELFAKTLEQVVGE